MRFLVNALLVTLMAFGSALPASAEQWHGNYFPNFELTDQDGVTHKVYDDLLKDRVVAINFIYTRCKDVCPADTAQLSRVQDLLEGQLGKDVFLYSISLDPDNDSPDALKTYMHMFGVKPGWSFFTGKKADIELLERKFGLIGREGTGLKDHAISFIIGNERTGQWIKRSPYDDPKVLAILLGETLQQDGGGAKGRESYAAAPEVSHKSAGDYLFRTRCASCHTMGKGDRLGPDLAGVLARRPKDWLVRWLKEPDKMIAEKDPAVLEMMARYRNLPMPNLGLNDKDAQDLMEFFANPDSVPGEPLKH
jgi:protein SCO1/2